MANLRKDRGPLAPNDVKALTDAFGHADTIGRRLNGLVTIRPDGIDHLPPAVRTQRIYSDIKYIGERARENGGGFTAIMLRECNPPDHPRGPCEHVHILMRVTRRFMPLLRAAVARRFPGGVGDVRWADRESWTHDGKRIDTFGYVTKVRTPQAGFSPACLWRQKNGAMGREGTGDIHGRRWTMTRDINAAAVAQWQATRQGQGHIVRPILEEPTRDVA